MTIQTPTGEVTFKETTVENQTSFDDRVSELTKEELAALERDTARVPGFIAAYVPSSERAGDVLEDLDKAFSAWLKAGNRDMFTSQDVIRVVGCGLGTQAIQRLGLRWVRVTDKHGTDIALVSNKPETRSYPFTSVQYRIEDGKTDFIAALYLALEHLMKTGSK